MVAEGPLTPAQIYEQITGGKGTETLVEGQTKASDLSSSFLQHSDDIAALRNAIMAGWRGQAGAAAADATAPLVRASSDDAVQVRLASTAMAAQADAFGVVKNQVRPVAPNPPTITAEDLQNMLAGHADYQQKLAQWQEDAHSNIQAFSGYHSASTVNGQTMPRDFQNLTLPGDSISLAGPTGSADKLQSGGTAGHQTHHGSTGGNGPEPGHGSGGAPVSGTSGKGTTALPSGQGASNPPPGGQGSAPQGTDPSGIPISAGQEGSDWMPGGRVPSAGGDLTRSPGGQSQPPGQEFSPEVGGFRPLGSGGTAAGPGEYGSAGGYRPGGPGSGAGGRLTGESPGRGAGAGPLPERGAPAGVRGTGGAAGAREVNGMPIGPSGARKAEEDKEKRAPSYLLDPDPNDTFGNDQRATPPTIG